MTFPSNKLMPIYLDFQKAFDKVSHPKLLLKLKTLGISGNFLNWIEAFLTKRTQQVVVSGILSDQKFVESSVPQGTVLAPTLFILFISDIQKVCKTSQIKLFADDVTIFQPITDFSEDPLNLQNDLDAITKFAENWQLSLSIEKCVSISYARNPVSNQYSINGQSLESVGCIKDLGFNIDHSVKFSQHCQKISNSARSKCCLIRRTFLTKSENFLTQMFNVFVRPYLEYGSCIWSPHLLENIDIIESVQRRYTKRYPGMWDVSYLERLKILGLDSLEIRRIRNDLYECFKILKNFSPLNKSEFFEPPRLHSRLHLAKTRSKCNERYHFFSNRVVDIFNSLPDVVVQATSLNQFKAP